MRDLGKGKGAVITGVLANDDVVRLNPQRKHAQRKLTQLHRAVEPLLQLCLDLPTVLIDINNVRKRQECSHYEDNKNNHDDDKLPHESS